MPSLTDVYFDYDAFQYKNDVTIQGSTRFIPLSQIDIGTLQRFFPYPSSQVQFSNQNTNRNMPLRVITPPRL